VEPMEGIFDNMILNLLKDALDVSKIDKPKLKSAVSLAADACKPATKLPADLDDKGWDMLKGGDPVTFAPWLLLLLQFAPMMVELIRKLLGK
jgi:hypothetical protein